MSLPLVRPNLFSVSLCAAFFVSALLPGAAPAIDFDGDGKSDVVIAQQKGKKLRWSYAGSASGFQTNDLVSLASVGSKGSVASPASWVAAGLSSPAVLNRSKKNVTLSVNNEGSNSRVRVAKLGQAIVVGADTDGDGSTELIVFGKNGSATTLLDPLSANSAKLVQSFSKKSVSRGAVGFANLGSGDEAVVVSGASAKKRKTQRNLRLQTGDGSSISLPGTLPAKPQKVLPISNGTTDAVLVVTKQRAYVYTVNMDTSLAQLIFTSEKYSGRSQVIVGDFLSASGEELGIFSKGNLSIINPFTLDSSSVSGLPAKKAQIGGLADVVTFRRQRSSGGSGGSFVGNGLGSVCPGGVRSVPGGLLWKPEADAKLGPPRAGKPVILFQSNKPGTFTLDIFDSRGNKVCTGGFKAPTTNGINCNSAHYYVGWSGGCGASGGGIAASARDNTGSSDVYVKGGGGTCFGPINPTSRVGGIGC